MLISLVNDKGHKWKDISNLLNNRFCIEGTLMFDNQLIQMNKEIGNRELLRTLKISGNSQEVIMLRLDRKDHGAQKKDLIWLDKYKQLLIQNY